MKNKRKNAFTLVELLAVLVILAVILVIAIPKVISIIKDVRISTLESTAKLVALSAEKKKVENEIIGNNEILTCENVVKINDIDYENCYIEFINNKAVVTIIGKGTFKGMNACEATKNNANVTERCLNKKVEVTLELNGGSALDITGIYKEGTIIDLEDAIKENSTFLEYKVVSGNSVISNNKLTVGSTNTIIYAVYERWPSLEIDLDEGIDNTIYNEKYKSGSIIELEVPTKDRYTFTGWKVISGNGIVSGNTFTMGNEDTIVKAEWKINMSKLDINLDDGNINQQFENEYQEGTTIELVIPTKPGYTFSSWSVSGNGASINNNTLIIGNEETKVTAIWTPNIYKVTFNTNGGTVSIAYKNVTYNDIYGEMPIPVKDRYIFNGWYTKDDIEVKSTSKVEILNDIELYAKYISCNFVNIGNINGIYDASITTTSMTNYKNLSKNNFIYEIESISLPDNNSGTINFSKTYNSSNGNLVINRSKIDGEGLIEFDGVLYGNISPVFVGSYSSGYSITIDCTGVKNWKNRTENDFIVQIISLDVPEDATGEINYTKTYNSSTGILSLSRNSVTGQGIITTNFEVYTIQ